MYLGLTEDQWLYLTHYTGTLVHERCRVLTDMAIMATPPGSKQRQQLIIANKMPLSIERGLLVGAQVSTIYASLALDVYTRWGQK